MLFYTARRVRHCTVPMDDFGIPCAAFFLVEMAFFPCHFFAQGAAGKTMVAHIKVKRNAFFFAVFPSGEVALFVFVAYNAHVQFERAQYIFQILFGCVGNDFVHKFAAFQLDVAFHNGLCWSIFLWSVERWIRLQAYDQVIALALRLFQHFYMSCVQ